MNIRNFTNVKSLLLENKTLKQTIFKNTFWLAVAEGVTRFLKLILIIYVARILGATEYGKFTFALAFVSLFVIFSDFGLSQITIREFSRDKEKESEYPAILSLKILLSLGALILILIGSFFVTLDLLIRKAIWILAIYILTSNFSEIIYAFLRARQRMEYEAFAKIFQAILVNSIGFFVILNFPSVENLSYSYLFASLIALIFILIFFYLKVYRLYFSWNRTIWQKFLTISWPLALAPIFIPVYSGIDSVMLGFLGQITQTGWYNAAYKIILVTLIPMDLISESFYPALSIAFKESKEKLQKIWNYQMEIMITLAVPLVVGGITLAPKIINFIYNQSYNPSILALQILIVMAGTVFLFRPFHYLLIVTNQQKKIFYVMSGGAIINAILNLILIPKFSLYGAAVSTTVSLLLVFFLLSRFTLKLTPIKSFTLQFFLSLIGISLSTLSMYFIISQPQIYNLNIFLSILIGVAIYLISLLVYKKVIGRFLITKMQRN